MNLSIDDLGFIIESLNYSKNDYNNKSSKYVCMIEGYHETKIKKLEEKQIGLVE